MTGKLEEGEKSVDVFKADLTTLTSALIELQSKLIAVHTQVQGTSFPGFAYNLIDTREQADHLRAVNKMRSGVLSDVLQGHSWGFWLFFALFQCFFIFAGVFYKQSQNERNKAYY